MTARRARRGMTIIEVMVGLAIIVVMASVSWSVLASTMDARDLLAERDEVTRSARVTLERLRRELQLAYLTKQVQAINSYQTVFVGTDENPDRLYFATIAHQRLYRDSRECDQAEVTVWADSISGKGKGSVLFHRESPRVDERPAEDGVIFPLAYNVRSFNLRYLDSRTGEWTDEWDSRGPDQLQRLPRAVQIALVLIAPDGSRPGRTVDVPMLTTVLLEQAEALQQIGGTNLPDAPPEGQR
jgi:general secretion pathway protein J